MVYFPDSAGNFYAVNAKTGAVVWSHQISDWTGITGDFARADPLVVGNLVIIGNQAGTHATWSATTGTVGAGASVIAVAAETGAKVWQTQVDSYPAAMVTSSPIAYNGVIYVGVASSEEGLAAEQGFPCCVSRGSVVALNAQTGAQIGHVRQRGGNSGVAEVAVDHAAAVAIWVGTASIIVGVSSAIGSVCM